MSTHIKTASTFGTKAPTLKSLGFDPVPVKGKAPRIKGWATMPITEESVNKQANKSYAAHNVGIRCSDTVVGIDVDVRDEQVADKLHKWLENTLGDSMLTRVGNKPKFLVPVKSNMTGLRKLVSPTYTDGDGNKHQIEILGNGRQFVAYGIHPDTQQPYVWIDDKGPAETSQSPSDLPRVDHPLIEALLSEFDRLAKAEGWTCTESTRERFGDGDWGEKLPVYGFTLDHARGLYEALLPFKSDDWSIYDAWLKEVLMPLHHQFEGSAEGQALAHEISAKCPNYDADTLDKKWDSFRPDAANATTIRSVTWMARELTDWTPPTGLDLAGSQASADEFSNLDNPEGREFAALTARHMDARCVPTTMSPAIDWFAKRYFVISEGNKPMVAHWWRDDETGIERLRTYTPEDFKKLYSNAFVRGGKKPKLAADCFLKSLSRKTYFDVILDVSGKRVPCGTLNLFRGWSVKPQHGADTTLIHDHIREVLASGDESLYEYILGWCANAFQRPDRPGEVALVLKSGQGTGKGLFGHLLHNLAGSHGCYINNPKHLTGEFNAHLEGKVILFADEAFFAGDNAHRGVLKGLLTDPTLMIRRLYNNAVQRKNTLHVLMASNEGWAVPTEIGDRRFAIVDVSQHRKEDRTYFKNLANAMDDRNIQAAFLEELLTKDLSAFEVRDIPNTMARVEQQTHSLKGVQAWLHDRLSEGEFSVRVDNTDDISEADNWPKCASTSGLYADFGYWEEKNPHRRETHHVSLVEFGKVLKSFFQKRRERTDKRRWGYTLGSLDEARRRFCAETGLSLEWEEL